MTHSDIFFLDASFYVQNGNLKGRYFLLWWCVIFGAVVSYERAKSGSPPFHSCCFPINNSEIFMSLSLATSYKKEQSCICDFSNKLKKNSKQSFSPITITKMNAWWVCWEVMMESLSFCVFLSQSRFFPFNFLLLWEPPHRFYQYLSASGS